MSGMSDDVVSGFCDEKSEYKLAYPALANESRGESVTRNGLVGHDTFSSVGHDHTPPFRSVKNKSEVMSLCRTLDKLFHLLGAERAKRELALEFFIRRVSAILTVELPGT